MPRSSNGGELFRVPRAVSLWGCLFDLAVRIDGHCLRGLAREIAPVLVG